MWLILLRVLGVIFAEVLGWGVVDYIIISLDNNIWIWFVDIGFRKVSKNNNRNKHVVVCRRRRRWMEKKQEEVEVGFLGYRY